MPTKAEELIKLAQARFNNLSNPECKLLQKVADGEEADYSAHKGKYHKERILRASLVTWICTDVDASKFITHQGLNIINVTIKSPLNLSFSNIEFPLIFGSCYFMQGINLSQVKLRFLDLSGSQVLSDTGPSLDLTNAEIEGRLLLGLGFKAYGEVELYNAKLGSLECDGGTFETSDKVAIRAEGVEIRGSAFFRKKEIEATGETYEFESVGEVTLSGAVIGGGVYCENGTFNNLGGTALNAQNAQIGEDIFLYENFCAFGEIFLSGAKVGGDLVCDNGRFYNSKGNSLTAEGIEIKGSASFLESVFDASKTALSLTGAKIGLNLFLTGSKIKGTAWIANASIGGSFECLGSTFDSPKEDALMVQNTNIKGSILLRKASETSQSFKAIGRVSLNGTSIGGNLECCGATFNNEGKDAILLQGAKVERSITLYDVEILGNVVLLNAIVNGSFTWIAIQNPRQVFLDLRSARIQTIADHPDSWPQKDGLLLAGLVYERIHEKSPLDYKLRLEWLRLQRQDSYSFQPYAQLAKVMRESGLEEEATEILIAKQRDKRFYGKLNWFGQVGNWILDLTIAYGYKTYRVLFFSSIFVIIGAFLFWIGCLESPQLISPSKVRPFDDVLSKSGELSEYYPKFNPIIYSLDTFIPIVNLHQQDYWLPNANRERLIDVWPPPPICSPSRDEYVQIFPFKLKFNFKGAYLRCYMWFHIIAGWFFSSLGVAGLSGLVRRIN